MGFLGWNIGVSAAYCRAHHQDVTCDFNNFQNVTALDPDYDLVTKAWWGAFLTTAWATALVSLALISLESLTWLKKFRRLAHSEKEDKHDWVGRCMRVMERLINSFSEQQTITSLSLIVVAGHNGCEISVYVFNLICFFVVMSLITHLNALTNTENWFADPSHSLKRGIINGVVKVIPILVTIVLAGFMLGSRAGGHFPVFAGPQATFKAVCFESTSQNNPFDGHKNDWTNNGFIQYLILTIDLLVVAGIFAIALIKKIKGRPRGFRAGLSMILRWLSTLATTGTLVWLSVQYVHMRKTMEENKDWYNKDKQNQQYSFFSKIFLLLPATPHYSRVKYIVGQAFLTNDAKQTDVVQWALFASSVYSVANALADAYKPNESNVIDLAADKAAYSLQTVADNFAKIESNSTGPSPDWT